MTEENTVAFVAFIILFAFLAFLIPQILNNAYASTTSSYARPLMLGMVLVIIGSIVYLVAKRLA